uniref:hypothetical protein n=1 Tax=Pseudomonas laurentiana TaxID=2364649 RepID=UPI0029C6E084|nr:hypothetical protein [Pseudomonas laurentiana]
MATTPQQRNKKSSEKKKAAGEKELRHKVRPGIPDALSRVKARADMSVSSELLQVAIMKMDLMTDEELAEFTTYSRPAPCGEARKGQRQRGAGSRISGRSAARTQSTGTRCGRPLALTPAESGWLVASASTRKELCT